MGMRSYWGLRGLNRFMDNASRLLSCYEVIVNGMCKQGDGNRTAQAAVSRGNKWSLPSSAY